MDEPSLNHYEERLYSVFKTFDVDNEEALNKAAVLALCDALQLEQRGAALVDTLFERRDQRVTFAQFRSGLLTVLGDHPPAPSDQTAPSASDDDSSGREVAPKFVFGSKKYGRRSRPPRGKSTATESSAESSTVDLELDHSSRVDCERALQLCRRLCMDGIDRRIVERIFESVPAGETTVGEFFARLNASLSMSVDEGAGPAEQEEMLPAEALVEAWERAGVQRPRRLLTELGFEGDALAAARLEVALDDECRALAAPPEARALLLLAALVLARVRRERAVTRAAAAAAERDRLRADVDEANRRARLLAQEVDESHARLEAESAASLRRAEARHADALRVLEAERAAERERGACERAALQAEAVRRADAEQQERAEAAALRTRVVELEARAAAGEERAAAAEREGARLAEALREARERAAAEAAAARTAVEEGVAREAGLRAEAARLRDRCDELCAQLEARERPARRPSPPHTWHEEAARFVPEHLAENESPPVSLEPASASSAPTHEALAEAEARHLDEKQKLEELIKELEASLEQMRDEYERCEDYWSSKLAEERALLADEQRAGDERLAQLAAKVADYERQYSARLPAIAEAPALEARAAELDAAATELARQEAELRRRADEARRRDAELRRRERELARVAEALARRAPVAGAGAEVELRARLARAEAGAARLAARLAHADLLVKDLYVENCLLGPPPRRL